MRFQIKLQAAVLALAVFALLPTIARAGEPSSGAVYDPVVPTIKTHTTEATPKAKPKGHPGSTTGKERTDESTTRTEPEGESESRERQPSVGNHPGEGGNEPPGSSGKPSQAKPTGHPDTSKSAAGGPPKESMKPTTIKAFGTSGSAGSDGSSPVVPILIAMAVLAALSIGVFLYRGRKEDASAST